MADEQTPKQNESRIADLIKGLFQVIKDELALKQEDSRISRYKGGIFRHFLNTTPNNPPESSAEEELEAKTIKQFNRYYQRWRHSQIATAGAAIVSGLFWGSLGLMPLDYLRDYIKNIAHSPTLKKYKVSNREDAAEALLRIHTLANAFPTEGKLIERVNSKIVGADIDYNRLNPESSQIQVDRLIGATYLRVPLRKLGDVNSLCTLLIEIAEQKGDDVYSKNRFASYLKGKVPIQLNDLDVPREGIEKYLLIPRTERQDNPHELKNLLANLAKERAALLKNGTVYIKPTDGARGIGITRLSYDGETVELSTTLDNIADALAVYGNEKLYRICFENDRECLELTDRDTNTYTIETTQGRFELEIHQKIAEIYNQNTPAIYSRFSPLFFLHRFNFEKTGESGNSVSYRIKVKEEELENLLIGLEAIYLDEGIPTFMEQEIPTQYLDGRTWEVRVINFADGFANGTPREMYVKMGEGDLVANIAQGGEGKHVEETVKEAYRQLRSELRDEEITALTIQYIGDLHKAANEIVDGISSYLTSTRNRLARHFPMRQIPVDSISTDFMAEIVTSENGERTLKPKIVDINMHYGYEGLRSVDAQAYSSLANALRQKKELVFRFLEDYARK